MNFEQDFKKHIFVFAKSVAKDQKCSVDELINDAYVRTFGDPNYKYSLESFKKAISYCALNYKNELKPVSLSSVGSKPFTYMEDVCCKKCKQIKPIMCFPTYKSASGILHRKTCHDCMKARYLELYHQKKHTLNRKEYFKEYQKKNRVKLNKYRLEWAKNKKSRMKIQDETL